MKEKKLIQAMGLADDKFVEEADPEKASQGKALIRKQKKTRRREYFWRSVAAGFTCAAIAVSCWLFIPFNTAPPSVAQYADSEYYDVIQKLNEYNYVAPEEKNNYEKYVENFFDIFAGKGGVMNEGVDFAPGAQDGVLEAVPDYGMDVEEETSKDEPGDYIETTDNQVQGVIEADLIKRTGTHIFYLDNGVLRAFSIAGEESKEVGCIKLEWSVADENLYPEKEDAKEEMMYGYLDAWEFYLTADGKTAIIVAPYYSKTNESGIALISVDVSDPTQMTVAGSASVNGGYMSSRLVDGSVLLITEFRVKSSDALKFDEEETFVPQIETNEGTETIPADNIVAPETLTSSRYTAVWKLDEKTLEVKDSAAFLSYSDQIYVSQDNIYATRTFTDRVTKNGYSIRTSMTQISCVSYAGETMEYKGSITLEGYVKDQYSLDEYEDILRVVTTTSVSSWKEYTNGSVFSDIAVDDMIMIESTVSGTNANLYCIDLNIWEIAAEVLQFAPQGETVRSVRFDKEMAYVCTSVQLSDPVFFFDLSDLNNITVKDTGTIEGFSSSLVNFGNGYLLGIGRGNSWDSLKIEIYEEYKDEVISVCSYDLEMAEYSTEYKSYYIDRTNQFVGLGVHKYGEYKDGTNGRQYILLFFDGYQLVELVSEPLWGDLANMRAVYIDGYLYMFGAENFAVEKVWK